MKRRLCAEDLGQWQWRHVDGCWEWRSLWWGMSEIIEGVDNIVGINVIRRLWGVTIDENSAIDFREAHCALNTQPTSMTRRNSGPSPCKIKAKDFSVSFDGERWTVLWNWTIGSSILKNNVGCHETRLKEERAEFDLAIEHRTEEGILAS